MSPLRVRKGSRMGQSRLREQGSLMDMPLVLKVFRRRQVFKRESILGSDDELLIAQLCASNRISSPHLHVVEDDRFQKESNIEGLVEEEIGIDHTWRGHVFGTNSSMQHGIDGVDGSSMPEYHGVHSEESTDKSFRLKSGRYLGFLFYSIFYFLFHFLVYF